ncbi:MAG: iron-sulfur cluster assembly protein [Thermoproteota archaeon]|jgi:FeS assembly SUF system protein|nr:iron-sulfur cluster assembly protein [Thermoproteota archaeon]
MSEEPKKEEVLEALKNCYDPEIPFNIVDLGLIYDLKIENGIVKIKMTLTTPFCPVGPLVIEQVRQEVMKVKGVKDVEVELVWEPRWTPDRMSEEAKLALGLM